MINKLNLIENKLRKESNTFILNIIEYAKKNVFDNYREICLNYIKSEDLKKVQDRINDLVLILRNGLHINKFNNTLIEIFKIIPRNTEKIEVLQLMNIRMARKLIHKEQNLLNSITGIYEITHNPINFAIEPVLDEELLFLKRKLGFSKSILNAFKVNKNKQRIQFEDYWQKNLNQHAMSKKRKMLWYADENTNWLFNLQNRLEPRLSNEILTGSMFGAGIYFSPSVEKSKIVGLYDVNCGRILQPRRQFSWCYGLTQDFFKKRKYDSIHFIPKDSEDSEDFEKIIVYNPVQSVISYIIELK